MDHLIWWHIGSAHRFISFFKHEINFCLSGSDMQMCTQKYFRSLCWSYDLYFQVKPLFWVEAQVEKHSKSRIEITVKARSQFKERRYWYCFFFLLNLFLFPSFFFMDDGTTSYLELMDWLSCFALDVRPAYVFTSPTIHMILFYSTATNVEIELPVPADATNPNVRTSMGSASYAPEKDALIWKIRSFPGGKVYLYFEMVLCPGITLIINTSPWLWINDVCSLV